MTPPRPKKSLPIAARIDAVVMRARSRGEAALSSSARIVDIVRAVDGREERLAKNEIVFRDVNERIEKMVLGHQALRERRDLGFLCECSNVDCTLRLLLTLTEYEQARSDSTQFVVALGHELPEIEQVVFVADTYQLVRKQGSAAAVAEASDPRS